ncbi:MAG: PilZ domain-containing protein [Rubrivivax sp.]|nr:PilZ domain-containing protein [Rubrivivax sp.]
MQRRRNALRWSIAVAGVVILMFAWSGLAEWIARSLPELKAWLDLVGHVAITLSAIFIVHMLDRDAVKGEISRAFEEQLERYLPLGLTAKECGLHALYNSRKQARETVEAAVVGGKSRIYMLGVAFRETFDVRTIVDVLAEKLKVNPAFDLRILLLNPLTSPAVMRSFLETAPSEVSAIIEHHTNRCLGKGPSGSPGGYTNTNLWGDCFSAFTNLKHQVFVDRLRFYRRDPTVWMVMVDDRVFVESYTFGQVKEHRAESVNPRLGGHMPVLEFRGADTEPYRILNDHFRRLWQTSTDDPLHMGAQYSDADGILDDAIFRVRLPWLTDVGEILSREEKRRYPRQKYDVGAEIAAVNGSGAGTRMKGRLVDCSRGGVRLKVAGVDAALQVGEAVTLAIDGTTALAAHLAQGLCGDGVSYRVVGSLADELRLARA